MIRKIFAAASLAAAMAAGVASAESAMNFKVDGVSIDGTAYTGTVALTKVDNIPGSSGAFTLVWKVGSDTVEGVAVVSPDNNKVLSVGYLFKGALGVSVMTQEGDKATGIWWIAGAPGTGTETWTKQ